MQRYNEKDIKLIQQYSPKEQQYIRNSLRLLVRAYEEKPSQIFFKYLLPISLIFFLTLLIFPESINVIKYLLIATGVLFVILLLLSLAIGKRGLGMNDMRVIYNLVIGFHIFALLIFLLGDFSSSFFFLPYVFIFSITMLLTIYVVNVFLHLRVLTAHFFLKLGNNSSK